MCVIPDQCLAFPFFCFLAQKYILYALETKYLQRAYKQFSHAKILFRNLEDSIKLFIALASASGHFQERGRGRMAALIVSIFLTHGIMKRFGKKGRGEGDNRHISCLSGMG